MSDTPNKKFNDIFVGKDYEHWREIGEERGWSMTTSTTTRAEIEQALEIGRAHV